MKILLKRLAYQFNIPFNDTDTESELRRKLRAENNYYWYLNHLKHNREKHEHKHKKERKRSRRTTTRRRKYKTMGLKEVDYEPDDTEDDVFQKATHNNYIRSLLSAQEGEKLSDADIAEMGKEQRSPEQEKFSTNGAYNAFRDIPETGEIPKQQLDN